MYLHNFIVKLLVLIRLLLCEINNKLILCLSSYNRASFLPQIIKKTNK